MFKFRHMDFCVISKVSHYATCCVSRSGLCGMVGVTQFILFFGHGGLHLWWLVVQAMLSPRMMVLIVPPFSEVQRGQKFLDQLPVAPHGAALSYLR